MKRLALLTSGGDAPGMNAAIRAIVLASHYFDVQPLGYRHGFNGLLEQEYRHLDTEDVYNIIQRGGTILKSARCQPFTTQEGAQLAARNLNEAKVDGLIIIGGDGSFRGAEHLSRYWQGNIIGLPGTIDNDINGTDATIGYYTAIDTALESIDKVRDTADAFERIFLIEVMGRHAGFIGLSAGVCSGAEQVLLPELYPDGLPDPQELADHIRRAQKIRGKCSYIMVMSENIWPGGATDLANELQTRTGIECRPVILGHVQRGGSPVSLDRMLASKLGAYAVEAMIAGKSGIMIGERNQQLVEVPLQQSWNKSKLLDPYLVKIQRQVFDLVKNGNNY
ncbi:6-phosphofructokinase [Lacimicrobium alkaliphilum]|uniref:6-phosphofructokinase n=1 Tax=Lacimicrobium alkaliphilum TaxID=1526571 RepID=A0ABQ1R1Q5_9ALTE|nr:ATP-dependent 6-phosphofructokinase [Lacimicrobium alkaliphilum]GGD53265.1 ATP-dependent 6-phosphofructokinase 1 [Lacimicrobium alkaliphilum]